MQKNGNRWRVWLKAFRLRTLPLSVSGVILGTLLAAGDGSFDPLVFCLAMFTTLFLQILSNLANDYGDTVHGVDNEMRKGPSRVMQRGEVTSRAMRRMIIVFVCAAFISGVGLIIAGTYQVGLGVPFLFLLVGVGAIIAALKYTVGKNPYGYNGLGDLFVFLFFGLVGVLGTYFLHTHAMNWFIFLPATSLGLFSVGVLNLNNMRDIESDRVSGKNTLVVKLGLVKAKIYHLLLLSGAILVSFIFVGLHFTTFWQFLFILVIPLLFFHTLRVVRVNSLHDLDRELKKLAMTTLLFAVLLGVGSLIG